MSETQTTSTTSTTESEATPAIDPASLITDESRIDGRKFASIKTKGANVAANLAAAVKQESDAILAMAGVIGAMRLIVTNGKGLPDFSGKSQAHGVFVTPVFNEWLALIPDEALRTRTRNNVYKQYGRVVRDPLILRWLAETRPADLTEADVAAIKSGKKGIESVQAKPSAKVRAAMRWVWENTGLTSLPEQYAVAKRNTGETPGPDGGEADGNVKQALSDAADAVNGERLAVKTAGPFVAAATLRQLRNLAAMHAADKFGEVEGRDDEVADLAVIAETATALAAALTGKLTGEALDTFVQAVTETAAATK